MAQAVNLLAAYRRLYFWKANRYEKLQSKFNVFDRARIRRQTVSAAKIQINHSRANVNRSWAIYAQSRFFKADFDFGGLRVYGTVLNFSIPCRLGRD